ncbi:MAG: PaaI family thioesterase [Deltaproteobacteria bacterium]|nr:PaaI family thioesterase [Deltaproteobacteria bacterium]MBW2445761.1 PaaI family thioesterase [Deltaproteobacteria bacterium]
MNEEEERRQRFMSHWQAATQPAEGAWAQKRRLATAMRRVIDRLVTSDAPEEELGDAADRLERYADHLETHGQSRPYSGFAEAANAGSVGAFFDASPIIGLANPLAPPLRLAAAGDVITGDVHFGSAYEGPPGCVHGGWIAAAFDEFLGFVMSATGNPGMTGTLKVIYRSPTPLKTDLRFEAGERRIEGRKTFATGRLLAGDRLCAEAEGIFISLDGTDFLALLEKRESERRAADEA